LNAITTHVLDTSLGRPAEGVSVRLEFKMADGAWNKIAEDTTDTDGRASRLLPSSFQVQSGVYRLSFDIKTYFAAHNVVGFYPEVSIVFTITDPSEHYHVPLLLSPFGYSTYRGS